VSLIVDVPTAVNSFTVSDSSRFVIAFGCNDYGQTAIDPMLIRWSAQDDIYNWTPDATNQAGFTRLSHGSEIITTVQTRQEIVVFTDSSAYSLQYLGPPYVWAPQLLGDNISIISPNAVVQASGIVYWMGVDKFYAYDGRIQTLNCDLRRFVFQDINLDQSAQVFAGTNEGFNEVWWFYCSAGETEVDRYVIYNYSENVWYYGTLERTAWSDEGILSVPIAASSDGYIYYQESGLDDGSTSPPTAITAYVKSGPIQIEDGNNFSFVKRIIPDITFAQSASTAPEVNFTLEAQNYPGASENNVDGPGGDVSRIASSPVEEFTSKIDTRLRGRQFALTISSDAAGVMWRSGVQRFDVTKSGRR